MPLHHDLSAREANGVFRARTHTAAVDERLPGTYLDPASPPPSSKPAILPISSRIFANEITDEIISYLVGDPHTLLSCALVCHDWLPASRRCLFEEVRVRQFVQYQTLVKRVLHSQDLQQWLSRVRSFELWETPGSLWNSQQFIFHFARHLPSLSRLALYHVNWDSRSSHPRTYLMMSGFPRLQVLELYRCSLPSFSALRRLISSLPGLRELTTLHVQWPPASVAIATNHTSHGGPAIVALWTTGDVDDSLLTWLVQTPSKMSLRYVGFWDRTDKVPGWWRDAIARFMRAVGSRLTYLELPTLDPDRYQLLQPTLRLAQLRLPVYHGDWTRAAECLQQLSRGLEWLDINLLGDPVIGNTSSVSLKEEGLEVLDEVLDGPLFKRLSRVTFWVFTRNVLDTEIHELVRLQVMSIARLKLPKLCIRASIKVKLRHGMFNGKPAVTNPPLPQ
ncbi:hypothetical protein C8Q76DRAFT_792510 [Earliella scabrosa]|nr:hypothetical protein C8Q76DRAFT_792510 [Earliella scabrosa]